MSKFVVDFMHGTVHEVVQESGREHKLVMSRKKLSDGYHARYTLFRKLPAQVQQDLKMQWGLAVERVQGKWVPEVDMVI